MVFRYACLTGFLLILSACGSGGTPQKQDGDDGLDNGLIKYPADSEGYVTSAFQDVKVYSSTAMHYICSVVAVRDGYEPNALLHLAQFEKKLGGKINAEASGLLLKDATNWYEINRDKIDIRQFYENECRVPIENVRNLYGTP